MGDGILEGGQAGWPDNLVEDGAVEGGLPVLLMMEPKRVARQGGLPAWKRMWNEGD